MDEDTIQKVKDWCKEHYPEHEFCIARDGGDVLEVFLQSPEFTMGDCKIVSYNTLYPGEFNIYNIVFDRGDIDEKLFGKLKHMPSTPMTQKEMQKQCDIVSKVADCDPGEEEVGFTFFNGRF